MTLSYGYYNNIGVIDIFLSKRYIDNKPPREGYDKKFKIQKLK